jgi:hypothetical protein
MWSDIMKISGLIFFAVLLCSLKLPAQSDKYPTLTESRTVISGDTNKWDFDKTHTLSVAEANKDGHKYWGYYGLSYYGGDPNLRKAGLAFSNDLVHWIKYSGNPIIPGDCRWPTVLFIKSVFYLFYDESDSNNDSRIIMLTSKDGIHFNNKTVVIDREFGVQNQNAFIYYNKNDKYFYLFYYHGVEESNNKPLVGRQTINTKQTNPKYTKNFWQIRIVKSRSLKELKNATPVTLLNSDYTIASPSVTFFKGKFYLLTESVKEGSWDNKWVTIGYVSDKIDGGYKEVSNNPVFPDNDACAFQYVTGNQLYIFYSHCLDIVNWHWVIKMAENVK